jgi:hypothetical protein
MFLEFDEQLTNFNLVKRIFLNSWATPRISKDHKIIYRDVIEVHLYDVKKSDSYDEDMIKGYESNILVEYFDSYEEAELRYNEIKSYLQGSNK